MTVFPAGWVSLLAIWHRLCPHNSILRNLPKSHFPIMHWRVDTHGWCPTLKGREAAKGRGGGSKLSILKCNPKVYFVEFMLMHLFKNKFKTLNIMLRIFSWRKQRYCHVTGNSMAYGGSLGRLSKSDNSILSNLLFFFQNKKINYQSNIWKMHKI